MATARRLKLAFSEPALADIEGIHDYVFRDSPGSALRLVQRIRQTAQRLRDQPFLGRPGTDPGTREILVRQWPYVIVYEIHTAAKVVMVLRVFHGAHNRSPSIR